MSASVITDVYPNDVENKSIYLSLLAFWEAHFPENPRCKADFLALVTACQSVFKDLLKLKKNYLKRKIINKNMLNS